MFVTTQAGGNRIVENARFFLKQAKIQKQLITKPLNITEGLDKMSEEMKT